MRAGEVGDSSTEPGKERDDVGGQQLGLLERREVAALRRRVQRRMSVKVRAASERAAS